MKAETYDFAVIGAGPGGYVAAIRAAQLGMRTAIVEREHLGGICLNWGCIPTKALLRSAEVLELVTHAAEYGIRVGKPEAVLEGMVARSRKVAAQLEGGVGHLLKKNKVAVTIGEAELQGPGEIGIRHADGTTSTLKAKHVVIATGARARDLPGLEADGKLVWNYRHALVPDLLPKRLLVVGAGAIGIEFAHFFRALGSAVTVVEAQDRVLPVEDAEISAFAESAFRKAGMDIRTDAQLGPLTRRKDSVTAEITVGGKSEEMSFDRVISATGITANTEGLGLEKSGIRIERGHVVVDPTCRTGVEGVWAVGDVAGPPWLAHKASHEGVMAAEAAAGRPVHPFPVTAVPACTYCHPQVASVGFTEAAALAAGHKLRVGRFSLVGNGKAIALGDSGGMVKTVFDADSGELLGAHMIGPEVTEMIQGYAVARTLEATEAELMHTIFPHPTISEAMHESVLDAYGRAIHL